ncbi:MAG: Tad domain-containing protein [Alphaproteobacteria bacterium]|nr:Tad domain-containing protein [Alphaproteobacteria bacterium]
MFSQLKASLKKRSCALLRDKRGAVLIYTALATPVFIGTIGLSVDVAGWQAQKRQLQTIADSAAMGGALERIRSGTTASVTPAAQTDALTNGYNASIDTLVINIPPQSGIRQGITDSVEVIIRRETPTLFSHIVMPGTAFVSARAVAVGDINDTCMWALNTNKQSAFKVSGAAVVDLNCGIFDNSNDPDALTQSGSGCLSATNIKTAGGYGADCISVEPVTGANQITDPLEGFQGPTNIPACTDTGNYNIASGDNVTLVPCTYTKAVTVHGTVDLEPGLYVFEKGFSANSSAVITGDDVHIYLPDDSITINGGADVTLVAGTTDDYNMAGILIYSDRSTPDNVNHTLAGGASMDLEGILYFPSTDVKFAGGSSFDVSATMLIADEIDIVGNTNLGDFDGSATETSNLLIQSWLAE